MIDTNYRIGALEYLLDKDCLPEKYYPLIPLKHNLILRSRGTGYQTKNDLEVLSDAELSSFGLSEESLIGLLRRFLKLYDPKSQKFREIEKFDLSEKEILAYRELYYLPGVRQTRASLYYLSGYKTLSDFFSPKYGFGKQKRLKGYEKDTPGPGQYHIPCSMVDVAEYTREKGNFEEKYKFI